jgi:hypothetical protein
VVEYLPSICQALMQSLAPYTDTDTHIQCNPRTGDTEAGAQIQG